MPLNPFLYDSLPFEHEIIFSFLYVTTHVVHICTQLLKMSSVQKSKQYSEEYFGVGRRNLWLLGLTACTGCALGVGALVLYKQLNRSVEADVTKLKEELEALKQLIANKQVEDQSDYVVDSIIGALRNSDSNSLASEWENVPDVYFDAPSEVPEPVSDPFLRTLYDDVDNLLLKDSDENRRLAYNLFHDVYEKYSDNWDFLWRYARSTFIYGQSIGNRRDDETRLEYVRNAKKYAYAAFKLNPKDAEVNKWCAVIVGYLCDFVSMKKRIQYGAEIKDRVDDAFKVQSSDFILHHLMGRWCYNVAALSWIERKLAEKLFSFVVPSFDEALSELLKADCLRPHWHENIFYIIKCYLYKNDKASARLWFDKAKEMEALTSDDILAKQDILNLMPKIM